MADCRLTEDQKHSFGLGLSTLYRYIYIQFYIYQYINIPSMGSLCIQDVCVWVQCDINSGIIMCKCSTRENNSSVLNSIQAILGGGSDS